MTNQEKNDKLTNPVMQALLGKRNEIAYKLWKDEKYNPTQISHIMNISRQLVNYILNKKGR